MTTVDMITVPLADRSYDICVGAGLLAGIGAAVTERFGRRRVFIITDENVAGNWLPPVEIALTKAGCRSETMVLPGGEATKSFSWLEQVLDRMLSARIDRRGLVLALGGGVIGDLAGFAAAVALRGLDYVQVPTTLLAQVDSSVGGKTAINTRYGKNLVGRFHQPRLVMIDTTVLDSLPKREILAGYAEVVKYGLIGNRDFFDWLESNGGTVIGGNDAARQTAIVESCRAKAGIVVADEHEAGDRALLNFGHTFGHALEAEAGYDGRLLHGEAVAIGMCLAFQLSCDLGLCTGQDSARARRHLAAVGLPTTIAGVSGSDSWSARTLVEHMRHDKKVVDDRMRFVLARGIGDAFVTADVAEAAVTTALVRSLARTDGNGI